MVMINPDIDRTAAPFSVHADAENVDYIWFKTSFFVNFKIGIYEHLVY